MNPLCNLVDKNMQEKGRFKIQKIVYYSSRDTVALKWACAQNANPTLRPSHSRRLVEPVILPPLASKIPCRNSNDIKLVTISTYMCPASHDSLSWLASKISSKYSNKIKHFTMNMHASPHMTSLVKFLINIVKWLLGACTRPPPRLIHLVNLLLNILIEQRWLLATC